MDEPIHSAVGVQVAFIALVNRLLAKGVLDTSDLDAIGHLLTDASGSYEMKATQRASIEAFSESFMRLRADKPD
jgi:hypothetical protein